jgi:transcriptional regulator with GAF, ATPase, and Fis domain
MTADDDDRFLRRDDRGLARVLVEFAHTLGTDFSIQRILDYLVGRIVELLPVDGAGVMLMGRAQRLHFIAASDEKILVLQGLQNELGQGPCLAAYATGEAVAVTDLAGDVRFPTFSPRAAAAGLGAVFTFPMRLDENRLGALDLYRSRPGALNSHDLRGAQVLADVAAAYIFNAQARVDTSAAAAHLNRGSLHDPLTGLPNRTLLHELVAVGMSDVSSCIIGAAATAGAHVAKGEELGYFQFGEEPAEDRHGGTDEQPGQDIPRVVRADIDARER